MILINNKTNEGFSNVSKAEAARMVGFSRSTIHRWSKENAIEVVNHWTICYNEIKLKQDKGFKKK